MDIKIFTLCKKQEPEVEAGLSCIYNCVHRFFPQFNEFLQFTSQKRMLLAVSESLRAADVVIVAVQGNMYNATKKLLSSALDIKLRRNETVAAVLSRKLASGKMKQNTFEANVRFPRGSVILPTDSGINCGFAIASGGQHIIYMPIEYPKAEQVVFGSLYDYLADIEAAEPEYVQGAMSYRHRALIDRTLDRLTENSQKIAISGSCEKFIWTYASNKHKIKACLFFDDLPMKHSPKGAKQTCIDAAVEIRENNRANYGVFLSDLIEEDNIDKYIYIAIADETAVKTYKIFAEDGEDLKEFVKVCMDKLMMILYNYEKITNITDDVIENKPADRVLRRILTMATAGTVAAASVIGIIMAIIMK